MQAHEGESILSYLLSVPALGMTKPPSGGSQGAFTTPATNKEMQKFGKLDPQYPPTTLLLAMSSMPNAAATLAPHSVENLITTK